LPVDALASYQPGQKGHGGQMYFFCGAFAAVCVLAGQQASSGQHSTPSPQQVAFVAVFAGAFTLAVVRQHSGQQPPSGQQGSAAVFGVVFTLAVGRQVAAHSGVQPGGQVGSSQQSTAFAVLLVELAALA